MTLRLIQVGLGGWGRDWYAHVVSPCQDVETVAWAEIDAATLESAQQALQLAPERCFLQLEDALVRVEADAVLVTAGLPGHVPAARTALHARKHVLIEKPFAPTLAEAEELVELAEEQQRILMVSQNYRFAPAVRKARELVLSGQLGEVSSVEVDFRQSWNTASAGMNRHYHIWQPLLGDMTIHHFDLMRSVLGQEAYQVISQTWNPPWSRFDQPPAAALTIRFDGGTIVNYRGSWISQGPETNWSGDWRMDCEKGQIAWTSRGNTPDTVTLRLARQAPETVELPGLALQDRHGSLAAFIKACQTGETPECSGRDNLKTLALMLAAVESAETDLPVHLSGVRSALRKQAGH